MIETRDLVKKLMDEKQELLFRLEFIDKQIEVHQSVCKHDFKNGTCQICGKKESEKKSFDEMKNIAQNLGKEMHTFLKQIGIKDPQNYALHYSGEGDKLFVINLHETTNHKKQ